MGYCWVMMVNDGEWWLVMAEPWDSEEYNAEYFAYKWFKNILIKGKNIGPASLDSMQIQCRRTRY